MNKRIAIVVSTFNPEIGERLLKGAEDVLKKEKIPFEVFKVPGAFEIPLKAQQLARCGYDLVIALGCIIKGETLHFDLVAQECARGCMDVMLEEEIPIVFEVLACFSEEYAVKRSSGKNNKGKLAAEVALWWLEHP